MSELAPSHEGSVTYFRREGSQNIHIRFSVKVRGKSLQVRVSTGESDYRRARIKADAMP